MNDKELLDLFTDMVRTHTAYIDRAMAGFGLSNGQGGVITAIGRSGSLTQNELARFRQVTPATISIMLDRMERDGLVLRTASRENSRANAVTLTEKGQAFYQELQTLTSGEPEQVFKGLTEEEKALCGPVFRKIIENIRRKDPDLD